MGKDKIENAIKYIQEHTENYLTDDETKELKFFAVESDSGEVVWSPNQVAKIHGTSCSSTIRYRANKGKIDSSPITDGNVSSNYITKKGITQSIAMGAY